MLRLLKISQHHHSGKLRPHEHTSYLPLILLLGVVGFALSVYTVSAQSPGPESSSISLTGTVPGKPPVTAATVDTPSDSKRFATSPITVAGTCPAGTLVEVFKNDIFAGSAPCDSAGAYTLEVDLLFGQNTLIARVYDALNQPGPDSNIASVFYDALPAQADSLTSIYLGGAQLLINTDAVFRGAFPDQEMNVPIDIIGGTPPYAVNIQWGDSTNKVVPRSDNVNFLANHTYAKAGTYQVGLQVTDAEGRVAFLTVVSIVNGQPDAITGTGSTSEPSTVNRLLTLWPLYTAVVAVAISFWLGEWREKRVLAKRSAVVYH